MLEKKEEQLKEQRKAAEEFKVCYMYMYMTVAVPCRKRILFRF